MKKTVAAALAAAFVVGASSTTFAAANPFSDVPAGHWAYNSIAKLAAEGVVEGYGDGTYRGDRNITRYEMAQMVAKAMAKNPSGANKAEVDRLAAEFRDELDALGVRVAELEKYADKVVWKGKIEYTYTSERTDPANTRHKNRENENGFIFRFEPTAYVNDHWTVNARIDANANMKHDETTDFELVRGWAEGDYDKFNVKVGRFEFCPAGEFGLMWDTEISGAELAFGSKWKFTATGGRVKDENVGAGIFGENVTGDDPATVVGLRIDYDQGAKGLFGGAGWYRVKDDDLAWGNRHFLNGTYDSANAMSRAMKRYDSANIWTVNLGYKFTELLSVKGAYAQNTKADFEDKSWHAELDYGNYEDASEKGQWSVYAGYRKYGTNVSFAPTTDDALRGTRGWVVGANWAPFKNIGFQAKYFNGKYITEAGDGHGKAEKLFGRVEFFF